MTNIYYLCELSLYCVKVCETIPLIAANWKASETTLCNDLQQGEDSIRRAGGPATLV